MKTEYVTAGDLAAVLKKRFLWILIIVLAVALIALTVGLLLPDRYAATTTFYVRNLQSEKYLEASGLTSSQLAAQQIMAKEYAALVTGSDELLDRMIKVHELTLPREAVREMLSATADSVMIRVSATARDAASADSVIAALQAEFPTFIQQTAWPNLDVDFLCVILLQESTGAVSVNTHPLILSAIGAAAAFVLSYLWFFLVFLFGNRLHDAEEVSRALPDVRVLGQIPLMASDADAAEHFYALRERLDRADKAILFTSAERGTGKSFLLWHLASSLATAGKRVLVIDADLRAFEKNARFMPESEHGFSDFLAGEIRDPARLVKPTEQKNLFVLPIGQLPVSPADHPLGERVEALLRVLTKQYDVVLVDSPAIHTAPDASLLAPLFDGVVLVAATRQCGARQLRAAVREIENAKGVLCGIVLNVLPKPEKIK